VPANRIRGGLINGQQYFDEVKSAVATSEQFFARRRRTEKKRAFYGAIAVSVAAALSTLAIGIGAAEPRLKNAMTIVALVGGAITTMTAAYEAHWDYQHLWQSRTATLFQLQQLHRAMSLYASQLEPGEAPEPGQVKTFSLRLEAILEWDVKAWARLRGTQFPQLDDPVTNP